MSKATCRWAMDRLSRPSVRYLLEHERRILDAHLEGCGQCREFQEMVHQTGVQAPALYPQDLSPFLEKRLLQDALEGRMPASQDSRGSFSVRLAAGLVAAGLVGALVVWALVLPVPEFTGIAPTVGQVFSKGQTKAVEVSDNGAFGGADASMTIRFDDGKEPLSLPAGDRIWGTSGSLVRVDALSDSLVRLRFQDGKIVAQVDGTRSWRRFIIVTPSSEIEVRGTMFSVTVASGVPDEIRVLEGMVLVTPIGSMETGQLVSASEQLRTGQGGPMPATTAELESDFMLTGERLPAPVAPSSVARGSGRSARGSGSLAVLADEAIVQKRLADAATHIEQADRGGNFEREVPELLARLARAYRQQHEYKKAKETYQQLISRHGRTPAGRNAMVALAQLELNVLGEPDAAISHFEAYLDRAPDGYLKEEAWVGTVRANGLMGRQLRVIQLATRYLANHKEGSFRQEMTLRRGDAYVATGNCAQGMKDYMAVSERWPGSRESAKAIRGMERCGVSAE